MSRVFFTLLVVGLAVVSASAQTSSNPSSQSSCTLTVSQSPAIRGLRLGLSVEQLVSLLPMSRQQAEIIREANKDRGYPNYGFAEFSVSRYTYPAVFAERFAGIDSFFVTVFDGTVTTLRVSYAKSHETPGGASWPGLDDFIAKLSEAFTLPPARSWIFASPSEKSLRCEGFEVSASNSNFTGSITMRLIPYSTYVDALNLRRAADEENLRREFKP